jgi:hypothetical protein
VLVFSASSISQEARPEGHHDPDHLPTRHENVRNDRAQEQR